jgi:S1-C subfamily serine protease
MIQTAPPLGAPRSRPAYRVALLLAPWALVLALAAPAARAELPQVTMVRDALPSVVGIGIDARGRMPYRFSGDKFRELEELFSKEQALLERRAEPRFPQRAGAPSLEDIQVIGSGFFSSSDDLVVTAFDVVEGQREVYVINHENEVFRAVVRETSASDDIAVLAVEAPGRSFQALPWPAARRRSPSR